ncbi:ABC transporter substrate-binding protein [Nocardioides sp. Bht2]|uniref:ABC transporter substrate-binding protein n=1 Tax=Nocardioides sp. Bht2 TaxID=3392297 RepID=UPI0039B3A688
MKILSTSRRGPVRRAIAGAAGALLLASTLAACGGGSGDEKTASGQDKVDFGVFPVFVSLPVWVAQEQGFFDDHDLSVSLKTITTGPAMISALASGSLDAMVVGVTSVETARVSGMPLKMVAVTLPTSIYHVFGSTELMKDCDYVGQPYPAPLKCAKGKKIGIIGGLGTESHTVGLSLLNQVGLKEKDVTFVPIGGGEGGGQALKEGQIDIQLAEDTAAAFTTGLGAGEPLTDIQTQGVFESWVGGAAWAMDPEIQKNPEKFQRMSDALADAVEWIVDPANEAAAAKIFKKYSPTISEETIVAVLQNTRKSWGSEASCDQVMNAVNWLVENGTIDGDKADKSCDDLLTKSARVTK